MPGTTAQEVSVKCRVPVGIWQVDFTKVSRVGVISLENFKAFHHRLLVVVIVSEKSKVTLVPLLLHNLLYFFFPGRFWDLFCLWCFEF